MKRRDFLPLLGALGMTAWGGEAPDTAAAAPLPAPPASDPASLPVMVIGAGMAGLPAARTLADGGKAELVIEARDRIGGRLWTSSKWADVALDPGATWIHGDGADNPVASLARTAGARTTTSFDNSRVYLADGSRAAAPERAHLESVRRQIQLILSSYQDQRADRSLQHVVYQGLDVTGKPVLLGFNAAQFGASVEAWSDAEIVGDAMRTLRTMHGHAIPAPDDWQVTRWGGDPYARGACSYNKLGVTPAMRDALASNAGGSLLFAGEATERQYFQSVHGAYLSGPRAASSILQG